MKLLTRKKQEEAIDLLIAVYQLSESMSHKNHSSIQYIEDKVLLFDHVSDLVEMIGGADGFMKFHDIVFGTNFTTSLDEE